MRLTPLETMFVEEFCRFAGAPTDDVDRLRIASRRSNSAGFVSTLVPSSVPDSLRWRERFFDPSRVAIVGRQGSVMLMLLVFEPPEGKLVSIEGDAMAFDWDELHEPAFWSETDRIIDQRRKG